MTGTSLKSRMIISVGIFVLRELQPVCVILSRSVFRSFSWLGIRAGNHSFRILCLIRCLTVLETCSSSFQHKDVSDTGSEDTGRYFAASFRVPFLIIAFTFACFRSSGTVASLKDLLNKIVRIGASSEAQSFRMRLGMLSVPVAFLELVLCESFRIPSSSTWILSMSGYGLGMVFVFLCKSKFVLAFQNVWLVLVSVKETTIVFQWRNSNRVSDFHDLVSSLFPKAILFDFYYLTWVTKTLLFCWFVIVFIYFNTVVDIWIVF